MKIVVWYVGVKDCTTKERDNRIQKTKDEWASVKSNVQCVVVPHYSSDNTYAEVLNLD